MPGPRPRPSPTRALFIGRFQPFHRGHLQVIEKIAGEFDSVIIGIGSSEKSHTKDNPFSAGERHLMIQESVDSAGIRNYFIIPIPDVGRNALWASHVASLVPPFDVFYTNNALPRRLFEEAGYKVRPAPFFARDTYAGTLVREAMLSGANWQALVPKEVVRVVEEIHGVERMRELTETDE